MAEGVGLEPSLLCPQALHPKGTLLLPLAWRPQASHLLPKVSLALMSMLLPASWGDQTRLEEQILQRSGARVGSGGGGPREGVVEAEPEDCGSPLVRLVAGGQGGEAGSQSRAALCPGCGAGRGSSPLRTSSPQTMKNEGHTHTCIYTCARMHAHPNIKSPERQPLVCLTSAGPSNTVRDLGAHRAPVTHAHHCLFSAKICSALHGAGASPHKKAINVIDILSISRKNTSIKDIQYTP